MAGYRFYGAADRRQDEIWDYTIEKWGPRQAENYIRGLHQQIQKAADRLVPWRRLPLHVTETLDPKVEVFFVRYEMHFIFFRVFAGGSLGIMSILHAAMDLTARLLEDLETLDPPA